MQELYNRDNIILYAATTPEDYTRMFSVECASCMMMPPNIEGGFGMQKMWLPIFHKYGLHPAAWYHYTGYSQGMWLEVGGVPMARMMRYRPLGKAWNADGTPQYEDWALAGDVKWRNTAAANIMVDIAKDVLKLSMCYEMGVKSVATLNHFSIPALEMDGDYFCPLAHSDNNDKDFFVAFFPEGVDVRNPGPPVFQFKPHHLGPDRRKFLFVKSSYDWDGYVSAKALAEKLQAYQNEEARRNFMLKGLTRVHANVGQSKKQSAVTAAS